MSWGARGELSWSRLKAGITSSSAQHPSDLHSATPLGGGTPQHSKHLGSACGQPDVYAITTCTTRYTRFCRGLPQKIWSLWLSLKNRNISRYAGQRTRSARSATVRARAPLCVMHEQSCTPPAGWRGAHAHIHCESRIHAANSLRNSRSTRS